VFESLCTPGEIGLRFLPHQWRKLLCLTAEKAALRVVRTKLILPGVPDKRIVKEPACRHYQRLMKAGVEIYE